MVGRFIRLATLGAAVTAPVGYALFVRPWARTWGVDRTEAATILPGDDIVADPTVVETRAITIDAAPGDVWPWLVQMGYGRGGFYSYDVLDQKGHSTDRIVPEWQHLEAGDQIPTNPAGGFAVRVVEPEHALVLYVDDGITQRWVTPIGPGADDLDASAAVTADQDAAPAESDSAVSGATTGEPEPTAMPAGVRASGAILTAGMPREFAGTWAFVLRPTPEGRTRLIERFRFRFPSNLPAGAPRQVAMRAVGFGVFLMTRRQLLGIRERAERLARASVPAPFTSPIGGEPSVAQPSVA